MEYDCIKFIVNAFPAIPESKYISKVYIGVAEYSTTGIKIRMPIILESKCMKF